MRSCFLAVLLVGCAQTVPEDEKKSLVDAGGVDTPVAVFVDAPPTVDSPPVDAAVDAPPAPVTTIYAHSEEQLYSVNPTTFVPSWIGTMSDSIYDIALAEDGTLYAFGADTLYEVNTSNAALTPLTSITEASNGGGFVPNIGGSGERLVMIGFGGEVWEIDLNNYSRTEVGQYGADISSSGDIAHLDGVGVFATVYDQSIAKTAVAQINVQTFAATVVGNGLSQSGLWGAAAWDGDLYGFTSSGDILRLNESTGLGTVVYTSGIQWWGAAAAAVLP